MALTMTRKPANNNGEELEGKAAARLPTQKLASQRPDQSLSRWDSKRWQEVRLSKRRQTKVEAAWVFLCTLLKARKAVVPNL